MRRLPLLAGVGVLNAVALVLERAAVGPGRRLPLVVLAVVRRRRDPERLEVVDRAVEVEEVGLDVIPRVVRTDVDAEARDQRARADRVDLSERVARGAAGRTQ